MAAGLGFKTFTTGEVLTAADTNGYLMQGVNVFANAAARTAAITSPEEGQMSYLKDTNSTEYYSGSAWTAVAGASGGMTLISTTALTGASVVLSSIPQTYVNLYVVLKGVNNATSNYRPSITPNAGTCNVFTIFPTDTTTNSESNAAIRLHNYATGSGWITGNTNNNITLNINDYTNTTSSKPIEYYGRTGITTTYTQVFGGGSITGTTAITSLTIATDVGTFSAGSVLLYGVK